RPVRAAAEREVSRLSRVSAASAPTRGPGRPVPTPNPESRSPGGTSRRTLPLYSGSNRRRATKHEHRQVVSQPRVAGMRFDRAQDARADVGDRLAAVEPQRVLEPALVERSSVLVFGFGNTVAVHGDEIVGLKNCAPR